MSNRGWMFVNLLATSPFRSASATTATTPRKPTILLTSTALNHEPTQKQSSIGSHGIMERLPVDKSKSITFAAEKGGSGDTTVMTKARFSAWHACVPRPEAFPTYAASRLRCFTACCDTNRGLRGGG